MTILVQGWIANNKRRDTALMIRHVQLIGRSSPRCHQPSLAVVVGGLDALGTLPLVFDGGIVTVDAGAWMVREAKLVQRLGREKSIKVVE